MEQPLCGRQVITLKAAWPWASATSTMQVTPIVLTSQLAFDTLC